MRLLIVFAVTLISTSVRAGDWYDSCFFKASHYVENQLAKKNIAVKATKFAGEYKYVLLGPAVYALFFLEKRYHEEENGKNYAVFFFRNISKSRPISIVIIMNIDNNGCQYHDYSFKEWPKKK